MTSALTQPRRRTTRTTRLPPGQVAIGRFPRFGVDRSNPPPTVPERPTIRIAGKVDEPFEVALDQVVALPRQSQTSDFHCVAGWSALDLGWEGVQFRTFYQRLILPRLAPGVAPTHISFRGLDGVRATLELDDVLGDDVLLADRLDGAPLTGDHGAPLRLVNPQHYGYTNVKHVCRIDVHTTRPAEPRTLAGVLLHSHPRARVWHEERHGFIPGRVIRPVYALVRRWLLRNS